MAEQNYTPLNYTPAPMQPQQPMMSTPTGPQMGGVYGGQSIGQQQVIPTAPQNTPPVTPGLVNPVNPPQNNQNPAQPQQTQPGPQTNDIAFQGQSSSADQVLQGMYTGNMIQGTPQAKQDAQKRKSLVDAIATKTPQQIASMLKQGGFQQGLQVFKDLQRFYPAIYQQVQMYDSKAKGLDFANKVGSDIMGPTTGGVEQVEVIEPDNMNMLNQDTIDQISNTFGPTAGAMYSVAQQMLGGNPQIQSQQEKYTQAMQKRKEIQQDIDNTDKDVRDMLGSEVSDSFVSAYVARQTRDLNRELKTYKDIEDTEFSALQAMRDDALENIKMIQEGMKFDLQRQQFTAEQERRAKQFEYNVQQDSFNNQLKLAALQKEATPEWQYNKDLGGFFRTGADGQLEMQGDISGMTGVEQGAGSRWTSQFDNITRKDPNAPDLDIQMAIGTPILAPKDGTVIGAETQKDGNVQVKIKTSDGYTMTFNHLDPSTLQKISVGQNVTAGQAFALSGNTGKVLTQQGGQRMTPDPNQLASGAGGHLDMRVIGPDGKRLTSQGIQDLLRQQANMSNLVGYAEKAIQLANFSTDVARKSALADIKSIASTGDVNAVQTKLKNIYKQQLGATETQAFNTNENTIGAMKLISQELENIPTSYLNGGFEKLAQKIGKSSDPKLAKLQIVMNNALDILRRGRSGAALTEFEEAFYYSMFPSISKDFELNKATIEGLTESLQNNTDTRLSNFYGTDVFNNIRGQQTQQPQQGPRSWN